MARDDDRLEAGLPWQVVVALGLTACGARACGDEPVHPCLSVIEAPQPDPVVPVPRLEPCLSPRPVPPPEPQPAPETQGLLEGPDQVRERVLASGRLPDDVVARLRR